MDSFFTKKMNNLYDFYKTSNSFIFNDDCLNFLPNIKSNSINLILIDPPYLISKETNFLSGSKKNDDRDRFRISMDFGEWDKVEINFQKIFDECYRILKTNGTIIVFWDLWKIQDLHNYLIRAKFKQLRFIEWIKTNPVPINSGINYLTNAREIAITAVKKSKPIFNSKYDNGVYCFPIEKGNTRIHPTQKSTKLFEELIKKHTNENDVVLDFFLGGGTTAYASKNTNRKFIGCEIDKNYYKKFIDYYKRKYNI